MFVLRKHQMLVSRRPLQTVSCTAKYRLALQKLDVAPRVACARPAASSPSAVGQNHIVLGIESSCDDTGVAIVTSDGRVLGEAIASQTDIHAPWGGVVPKLAMEAHATAIDRVVDAALSQAGISAGQLDAVAVTIGPGLAMCLRVGVSKAFALSRANNIPVVYVHHMEAHALVARMAPPVSPAPIHSDLGNASGHGAIDTARHSSNDHATSRSLDSTIGDSSAQHSGRTDGRDQTHINSTMCTSSTVPRFELATGVPFPFLCLLVSGGHNLLVLVLGVGRYVQLGSTLDDALGEAYDKVARLLALDPRPSGGAALEALALKGNPKAFAFKVPMISRPSCDFSYAGLKTSTRLAIEAKLPDPLHPDAQQTRADIAASFQAVAVAHLTQRLTRGISWAREMAPELSHVVVAGGVACNQYIRSELRKVTEASNLQLVVPPPKWCTDNGVMVAWAGLERLASGVEERADASASPAQLDDAASTAEQVSSNAHRSPAQSLLSGGAPGDDMQSAPSAKVSSHRSEESADSGQSGQALLMQRHASGTSAETSGRAVGEGSRAVNNAAVSAARVLAGEDEWIELRPRWPLTTEKHPRCAETEDKSQKSARKARLHASLTQLTAEARAQQQGQQVSVQEGRPDVGVILDSVHLGSLKLIA